MAHQMIRSKYNPITNKKEVTYTADSANEVAKIGTDFSPGSQIIVTSGEFPIYILTASGTWAVKQDE